MDNLQKATAVGNDRKLLLKQLLEARKCLLAEYKVFFKKYTYDFDNKRLVSSCGKYHLQWQLRRWPDLPEHYHNQQTAVGCVLCLELEPLTTATPAGTT